MDQDDIYKRLNDLDLWKAEYVGRTDAWWVEQKKINIQHEEERQEMSKKIGLLSNAFSRHDIECIGHRSNVESIGRKIDEIETATALSTKQWSLMKGGYAAVCLVLTAIASLLGLLLAGWSAFKP